MLDYTKAALHEIQTAFKKAVYWSNFAVQVVYILYLLYALIAGAGFFVANLLLLILSVGYFAFFLVTTGFGKDREAEKFKATKKHGKLVYKWSKRAVTAVTLGLTIYGLYTAVEKATGLSVLLSALMVVGWILSFVFDVVTAVIGHYGKMFMEAIEADVEEIKKPMTSVANFFKKMKGEEIEEPKAPSKIKLKLKEKVEQNRAEARRKKEERKQEKREAEQKRKEEKRQRRLFSKQKQLPPASDEMDETDEIAATDSKR